MLNKRNFVGLLAAFVMVGSCALRASENTKTEIDQLKRDIENLRIQLNKVSAAPASRGAVDRALETKGYGPDQSVKTKDGRLTIGGLLQTWYYAPQTDQHALFDDPVINATSDTNEAAENNSFRIRRAELRFKMDIHENVSATVMIDPAQEAASFPLVTFNQANCGYIFKSLANVGTQFANVNGAQVVPNGTPAPGSTLAINNVETGAGVLPRLLEDAYINYHGVIPHHDFTVGQFQPFVGEEGTRDNGHLDFVERSFVGLLDNRWDLGAAFHGMWWDDRFQYWGGVYDGAGNLFGSATSPTMGGVQSQTSENRAATTSRKDIGYRIMLRPIYCNETWGNLEIGGGSLYGFEGSSNSLTPLSAPDNGLSAVKTNAYDHFAWLCYKPGCAACGLWIRAEMKWLRDRMAPGSVIDLAGNGTGPDANIQEVGKPITTGGFYAAMGYRLGDSCWQDTCPCWIKQFEFAGRYQQYQNVLIADSAVPDHTDVYKTGVTTAAINYYIKGHDAKIQMNYNFVDNPKVNNPNTSFHNTKDDSFVVNFQVAF